MGSLLGRAAGATVAAGAGATAVLDGYLAVVTVAAALRRRRRAAPGAAARSPRHRFAVLVPAHDEAEGIAATIDSIAAQDYPADRCSIHVVADNCTDATAEVVRRHGAFVHERHAPDDPGKGPALGWLVERLEQGADPPDMYIVLDADTTMAPSFVAAIDAAVAPEDVAWQGYYTVREPEASAATSVRHAALVLRHYVRPLGRNAIGGTAGLFGNGMAFRREVLASRGFSAHLTEDVELALELLLDGHRVRFVPDAVVAAEMPTTLDAARTQNERWERGRLELARRFVPELVRRASRVDATDRLANVDAALDQIVPPLSVLGAATVAGLGSAVAVRAVFGAPAARVGGTLAGLATVGLVGHVVGGLRVAQVPRSVYGALLQAPRLAAWKVGLWVRMLARPSGVTWTRTARNPGAAPGGLTPKG